MHRSKHDESRKGHGRRGDRRGSESSQGHSRGSDTDLRRPRSVFERSRSRESPSRRHQSPATGEHAPTTLVYRTNSHDTIDDTQGYSEGCVPDRHRRSVAEQRAASEADAPRHFEIVPSSNPSALFPRTDPRARHQPSGDNEEGGSIREQRLDRSDSYDASRQPVHERATPASAPPTLSDVQENFIVVSPFKDPRDWYRFTDNYPEMFDDGNHKDLYLQVAVSALEAGNSRRARDCLEKVVLLHLANGRTQREQDVLFEAMREKKPAAIETFTRYFKHFEHACQEKIGNKHSPRPPANQMSAPVQPKYVVVTSSPNTGRHGRPVGPSSRTQNVSSGLPTVAEDSVLRGPSIDVENPADTDRLPSVRGPPGDAVFETLDRRYIRREPDRAGRFFKKGRVFAILTHSESEVAQDTGSTAHFQTKKGGMIIYSHIRHFAVVREGHGYCWAVTINTYRGKGVAKKGLNAADISAHAIIHDSRHRAQKLRGEPDMSKSPIAVDRSDDAEALSEASRIHFAKVTTIEHNVRAKSMGMVSKSSMTLFESYWKSHLLG